MEEEDADNTATLEAFERSKKGPAELG